MASKFVNFRFKYPLELYVLGPSKKSVHFTTTFTHTKAKVTAELQGPVTQLSGGSWMKQGETLFFKLDWPSDPIIKDLVGNNLSEATRRDLARPMIQIVNHVLSAIRNFGFAKRVHLFPVSRIDTFLIEHEWEVEYSPNTKDWKKLSDLSGRSKLDWFLGRPGKANLLLDGKFAFAVKKAIRRGHSLPIEREFVVNALESLDNKNFRLAVLEFVIALEIVLSAFLQKHFVGRGHTTLAHVKNLISPNLQLSHRVSILIPLIFKKTELAEIDLSAVRNMITWRNKLVHELGKLPPDAEGEKFDQAIESTYLLINLLSKNVQHRSRQHDQ